MPAITRLAAGVARRPQWIGPLCLGPGSCSYTIIVYLGPMLLLPEFFPGATGFQWDEGNAEKNWLQHGVTHAEAEQVFFNPPVVVRGDPKHSAQEVRYFALGRTDMGAS